LILLSKSLPVGTTLWLDGVALVRSEIAGVNAPENQFFVPDTYKSDIPSTRPSRIERLLKIFLAGMQNRAIPDFDVIQGPADQALADGSLVAERQFEGASLRGKGGTRGRPDRVIRFRKRGFGEMGRQDSPAEKSES
jgi:hypothetical protein